MANLFQPARGIVSQDGKFFKEFEFVRVESSDHHVYYGEYRFHYRNDGIVICGEYVPYSDIVSMDHSSIE